MEKKMNGYVAIYKGKQIDIYADSSYAAQVKAQEVFNKESVRKINGYDIIVTLCEIDSKQVVHNTGGL